MRMVVVQVCVYMCDKSIVVTEYIKDAKHMIISDVDIRYTENMPILWGPFIKNFIYIFQDDYDNFIIPNADKLNCKKRLSHPVSEA